MASVLLDLLMGSSRVLLTKSVYESLDRPILNRAVQQLAVEDDLVRYAANVFVG